VRLAGDGAERALIAIIHRAADCWVRNGQHAFGFGRRIRACRSTNCCAENVVHADGDEAALHAAGAGRLVPAVGGLHGAHRCKRFSSPFSGVHIGGRQAGSIGGAERRERRRLIRRSDPVLVPYRLAAHGRVVP